MKTRARTRPAGDQKLVQIVGKAFADAARKSGDWLICKPGCTQCCYGPFPIDQLDAERLRAGLAQLEEVDPRQAQAIRRRAQQSAKRLTKDFPGDAQTGILRDDEESLASFEDFANDEPCPVLSKDGLCELYEHRPMTCRVFGPPIRTEGGLGHCELCYHGATPEQVAACEMDTRSDMREEELNREVEKRTGRKGQTTVAYALRGAGFPK